jgi:hypothetical protein
VDGLNLFAYVGSSPARSTDPLGLWRFCTLSDRVKMRESMERTTGTNEVMGALGWRQTEIPGNDPSLATALRDKIIRIPKHISDAKKYSTLAHELVGGAVSRALGDTLAEGGRTRANFPGGSFAGKVSGWHNVAMAIEFGALASRAPNEMTCAFAQARYQTAHLAADPKETVWWQKEIKELVDFVCDCEAGKFEAMRVKATMSANFCFFNEGYFDDEAISMGYSLTCRCKRIVSGTFFISFYD